MEERTEERKQQDMRPLLEIILVTAFSYVLYRIGIGEPFFLIPLLIFAGRHGKDIGLAPFIVMIFATALSTWRSGDFIGDFGTGVGLMLFSLQLYIPLSLLAAGIIWILGRKYGWQKRLAFSMLPSILFCLIYFLLLEHDPALLEGVRTQYENVFEAMLSVIVDVESVGPAFVETFNEIFFLTLLSIVLPAILLLICVNFFFAERSLHSREIGFEDSVSHLELKGWMIWILLGSWAMVLVDRFVSFPYAVTVALFNVAICMAIVYAVQGFSVVLYRLRKKGRGPTSFGLFMLIAAISLLMPGLNFITILGLPIVGAIESFFELRR